MQAATPPPGNDKHVWRRQLRERLRTLPDPLAASAAILDHLIATFGSAPRPTAAFAALPGEPDLRPLIGSPAFQVHLPLVAGERMSFHRIERLDQLEPGAYGIDSPGPECPEVPLSEMQLILVPGLALGLDGSRLGRGKGFYDRALAAVPAGIPRVGVCFDEQLFEQVPTEAHDIPLTHLLTPSGCHQAEVW